MAWSMHGNRHHDTETRWNRPPSVEEGQRALVHAPRADALLRRPDTEPATDASWPTATVAVDVSPEPTP